GLEPFREQVRAKLLQARQQPEAPGPPAAAARRQHRTRAALALLPDDPSQVAFLRERLLAEDVEPEEVLLIRDRLHEHGQALAGGLWDEAGRPDARPGRRFRALVALARFDPGSPRWKEAGKEGAPPAGKAVVGPLLAAEALHIGVWMAGLREVGESV